MTKKRGRCPSLIGSTHGAPKMDCAKSKRTCKRCDAVIVKDEECIVVPVPGRMGRRVYCRVCIIEIISQSRKDLDAFENLLNGSGVTNA